MLKALQYSYHIIEYSWKFNCYFNTFICNKDKEDPNSKIT